MENNAKNTPNFIIPSLDESKPAEIKETPKNAKFSNFDFLSKDTNLNIKIFGIGGAGCNIINHLKQKINNLSSLAALYAFNTDAWSLKRVQNIDNLFIIDKENLKGYGSSGNPQLAKQGINNDSEAIKSELKGTDVLFLISGFGKGTGCGATPEIAKIAKENGILTIAIVGMPSMTCEGKEVYNNAFSSLEELKKYADSITTICNERIVSNNPGINFFDLYAKANDEFVSIIDHIINMVIKPGEMNIDFSDIRSFFKRNKFFMLNHLILDDSKIEQNDFNRLISSQISSNISDVNITKANEIVAKLCLSQSTNNNFLQSFKQACMYGVRNNNISIVTGVDYSKSNKIEITYLVSATDELVDVGVNLLEPKDVKVEEKSNPQSSNIEENEYSYLIDEIKQALSPTQDLQTSFESKKETK